MADEGVLPLFREPGGGESALESLARAWGIETAYRDPAGREVRAGAATLRGALAALGVAVEMHAEVEDALWQRQQELHLRLVEPVTVSWEGTPPVVTLAPGPAEEGRPVECRLRLEGADLREWSAAGPRIPLPADLPLGRHQLEVRVGSREARTWVIRAPAAAPDPKGRAWGVYLPLYALRGRNSWGTGDFGDLGALLEWVRGLGGDMVGTRPLHAAFLDEPFDPDPGAPVSRLFWNELFVDVEAAPGLAASARGRQALESADVRAAARALHRAPRVDPPAAMALKRAVLEPLARDFFSGDDWRADPFQAFLAENAEIRTYARFRAACELWKRGWRDWPAEMRDGSLKAGDFGEEAARYHLYVQWLAATQMKALAGAGAGAGVGRGLYLDLPPGVHPDGYDVWRFRDLFADGATTGAPPDDACAGGQDRGTPPLHPERIRLDGHRYFAAALRALGRHAGALRIGPVTEFHRQWWVPGGAAAAEGVYVRYPAEELWAVACLEAGRAGTEIIGEYPGAAPGVREEMERRGMRRTFVVPRQIRGAELPAPPAASVGTLGTHDEPPFARWWAEAPAGRRRDLASALERAGALAPVDASALPGSQRARPVLEAALRWLAESPARLVMVNLEDLWLETEAPDGRRKARFAIETFREMPEVVGPLQEVARGRSS